MTPAGDSTEKRLSFHELAERELNDAARYYEGEKPGLGAQFIDEVERCTASIARHPAMGATVREGVRQRFLRRFPYALLYRAASDTIRILAVMNLRRRPTYWVGRT